MVLSLRDVSDTVLFFFKLRKLFLRLVAEHSTFYKTWDLVISRMKRYAGAMVLGWNFSKQSSFALVPIHTRICVWRYIFRRCDRNLSKTWNFVISRMKWCSRLESILFNYLVRIYRSAHAAIPCFSFTTVLSTEPDSLRFLGWGATLVYWSWVQTFKTIDRVRR